jgi:2-C-methyl-D-erythritol 4-phosphate cytidylyltransferase / 2-C-methyl-D-erythritol 2,4-cyclodiphosphate synthase
MNSLKVQHVALVPAAGVGQRFNAATASDLPKQYVILSGQPMLLHTVKALLAFTPFTHVLVVVSPNDGWAKNVLADLLNQHSPRLKLSFTGGDSRAATVRNGLRYFETLGLSPETWVWVHDAARPAISQLQLQGLAQALHGICLHVAPSPMGALLATPVGDTLKRQQPNEPLTTVSRHQLWQAQTPQCFGLAVLAQALDKAQAAGYEITDEASAIELITYSSECSPVIVQGSTHNFKVTHPEDAVLMAAVLRMNMINLPVALPVIAIGEGMDVHALVTGRPLILGGVTIPHSKGLQGHSDADALLHAITDALLGAAAMGDIGRLFPDTEAQYSGADSQFLLTKAYAKVAAAGWRVANVDATIVAQAPKMASHIPAMQVNIAACLNVAVSQVNIKAKTNEKLGWLGREEGIETRAVLLLQRV